MGLDPPLAWRSGAADSYGSATLVGQVDGNGQVIGNSFAAVGSVDLDIRAPAPYLISSANGAGTAICSLYLPPGPFALGLRQLFHHQCPTR